MKSLTSWLKDVVQWRNVVIFFTMLLAFVATTGFFKPSEEKTDKIILALLGLITLDLLIEKVSFLTGIEKDVKTLLHVAQRPGLILRKNLFIQEDHITFVDKGKDVLFVGFDMLSLVGGYESDIIALAESGTTFRFAMLDHKQPGLINAAAPILGQSPATLQGNIQRSLDIIRTIRGSKNHDKVQLYLLPAVPCLNIIYRQCRRPTHNAMRCGLFLHNSSLHNISANADENAHKSATPIDAQPFLVLRPDDENYQLFVKSAENTIKAGKIYDFESDPPNSESSAVP